MTKPKTLDQLRAEKERAETQLAQEQHKLERLKNRKKYLEKGERTKRTHRLCNLGGTIESLAPEVKDLTRTEMTELMEHIFSLSEVQRAVRGQFDGGGGLSKGRCPAVEVGQLFLLQGAVLEVAHDRVQLGHGIAHGRARGEYHATSAGDLIQIAALAEHIAGFLRFAGG